MRQLCYNDLSADAGFVLLSMFAADMPEDWTQRSVVTFVTLSPAREQSNRRQVSFSVRSRAVLL